VSLRLGGERGKKDGADNYLRQGEEGPLCGRGRERGEREWPRNLLSDGEGRERYDFDRLPSNGRENSEDLVASLFYMKKM